MTTRLIATVFLSLLLAACSSQQHQPQVIDRSHHHKKQTVKKWYKVRKGDTLYSIAWANRLHYRTLAYWNHIRPPYLLHPGQILRLTPRNKQKKKPARVASKPKKTTADSRYSKSSGSKSRTATGSGKVNKNRKAATKNKKAGNKVSGKSNPKWAWPTYGPLRYRYSSKAGGKQGIGIAGRRGQKIRAAAAGKVVYSGEGLLRYGKMIIVKHNSRYLSAYAHNQRLLVKEGAWVKAGQQIALMGSSGTNSTLVHFEIRRDGKPVNPIRYLPKKR